MRGCPEAGHPGSDVKPPELLGFCRFAGDPAARLPPRRDPLRWAPARARQAPRPVVGVAQLVRAPDCGSGSRGFESPHPPHASLLRLSGFATPDASLVVPRSCLLPSVAVRCRNGIGVTGGHARREEVGVGVEEDLRARPATHPLDPQQIRSAREVNAREAVAKRVRTDQAEPLLPEDRANQGVEHPSPEVGWVQEPSSAVREDQSLCGVDIRTLLAQQPSESRRELHRALSAGLRRTEVLPTREAASDPSRSRCEIEIGPAKGGHLTEPCARIREEAEVREVIGSRWQRRPARS